MIEIRNLHKSFGGTSVLRGIDLDVPTGESVVVLGRSGTGKSILLKQIIGLMKPDRGSIRVDGREIVGTHYDGLSRLRRRFGMLFQQAALFDSMSVAENIGLGLREHSNRDEDEIATKVAETLALVNLPGVETMRPADLSGGMRKRVGLARAIAVDPEYMLYDEPTTGLDPVSAMQINELILELQEKLDITSIVVTHDLHSAFIVGNRLCLLHDGRIHVQGGPDEIRATDDPIMREFLDAFASRGPNRREAAASGAGPATP